MNRAQLLILVLIFSLFIPLASFTTHANCAMCKNQISDIKKASCCSNPDKTHINTPVSFHVWPEKITLDNETAKESSLKGVCTCCFSTAHLEKNPGNVLLSRNTQFQAPVISLAAVTNITWNVKVFFIIKRPHRPPLFLSDLKKIRLLC